MLTDFGLMKYKQGDNETKNTYLKGITHKYNYY